MSVDPVPILQALDGVLGRLTLPLVAGALVSLAMDRLLKPTGPGLRREAPAVLVALGAYGLSYGIFLLASRRPLFSVLLVLAVQLVVLQVSNAKHRALREPFVFSDFGLFSQALRHPRLYLPFLGLGRAITAGAALALAVWLGFAAEPALSGAAGWAVVLLAAAAAALLAGIRSNPALNLDPEQDVKRVGLVPSLVFYGIAARHQRFTEIVTPWQAPRFTGMLGPTDALPDLVVIESESFFDVRRLFAGIRSDVLAHFDRIGRESVLRGRLTVPAWGANTMRTEFAFLTGLYERALGAERFNPYRLAARAPLAALPAFLRSLGYRTVCVHPHPASFFERHRVMPNLGFDDFIDLGGFQGAPRAGPYVADASVGDMVVQALERAQGPAFVFAITMENHGPLHLERPGSGDVGRFYVESPPPGFENLTVYLRHLANADRMIGDLRQFLGARGRESVLCFFGDHVPSMPEVYDALGFVDGRTDYLVWHSRGSAGTERDLRAEELGEALVGAALPRVAAPGAAAGGASSPPKKMTFQSERTEKDGSAGF